MARKQEARQSQQSRIYWSRSSSGSSGSALALLEPVPWKPRTVVELKILYLTLQPGPLALLAEVSFCGDGLKTVGCFSTPFVQLPAFRKVVSVAIKPFGPATIRVKVSAVLSRLTIILDGDVVVKWLVPAVTVIAPAGRV